MIQQDSNSNYHVLINTNLFATIKHRPWWDVDTWNSYFRSEIFCYSENTPLKLLVRRAREEGKHATGTKQLNNADGK